MKLSYGSLDFGQQVTLTAHTTSIWVVFRQPWPAAAIFGTCCEIVSQENLATSIWYNILTWCDSWYGLVISGVPLNTNLWFPIGVGGTYSVHCTTRLISFTALHTSITRNSHVSVNTFVTHVCVNPTVKSTVVKHFPENLLTTRCCNQANMSLTGHWFIRNLGGG